MPKLTPRVALGASRPTSSFASQTTAIPVLGPAFSATKWSDRSIAVCPRVATPVPHVVLGEAWDAALAEDSLDEMSNVPALILVTSIDRVTEPMVKVFRRVRRGELTGPTADKVPIRPTLTVHRETS